MNRIGKYLKNIPEAVSDMRRFGVLPSKLGFRIFPGVKSKVLIVSVPKSGTHLVERLLCLHPALYRPLIPTIVRENVEPRGGFDQLLARLRGGQILVAHLNFNEERLRAVQQTGTKVIFMVRDPRDVLISIAHFMVKRTDLPWHEHFKKLPDTKSRIIAAIEGEPSINLESEAVILQNYHGWFKHADAVVKFEDLIGSQGGGSDDEQLSTIERIFSGIGVPLSESKIRDYASKTFSSASPTFRKGRINQWEETFDDELQKVVNERMGTIIKDYGYSLT